MDTAINPGAILVAILCIIWSIYVRYKYDTAKQSTATIPSSAKLSSSSILEFAYLIGNLKKTERSGWVRKNIHKPESIADHMYRMGILSWIFTDQFNNYDKTKAIQFDGIKVIKMALVPDIIESMFGETIPMEKMSGVSKEESTN